MRPVLFLHGAGDADSALGRSLRAALGDAVRTPRLGDPHNPRGREWLASVRQELAALGPDPVLVGHSLGGSVLVKALAEGAHPEPVAALLLLSVPWWGPAGWDAAEFAAPDRFADALPPIGRTVILHSRRDPVVEFGHTAEWQRRIPGATVRALDGDEHEFAGGLPVLVEEIARD